MIKPWNFNPRFPRGKRLSIAAFEAYLVDISIHASRGGSDHFSWSVSASWQISIHASRGGSDLHCRDNLVAEGKFQSTLPAGEATGRSSFMSPLAQISIHASRGGSDTDSFYSDTKTNGFQSTLPAGEATQAARHVPAVGRNISIHASRGGSDLCHDGDFI